MFLPSDCEKKISVFLSEENLEEKNPAHIWPKTCTTFHPLAFVTSYIALVTAGNTQVISICYLS